MVHVKRCSCAAQQDILDLAAHLAVSNTLHDAWLYIYIYIMYMYYVCCM